MAETFPDISPLDREIDTYEDLVQQFEELDNSKQKGQMLYRCDVQYQKIQRLLANETTFKLKKRVVALKQRFDKEERVLLKEHEVEQLVAMATRLHILNQSLQCANPQTEIAAIIDEGDKVTQLLDKIRLKFATDQVILPPPQKDPKVKKILQDSTALMEQYTYLKNNPKESRPISTFENRESPFGSNYRPVDIMNQIETIKADSDISSIMLKRQILCMSQSGEGSEKGSDHFWKKAKQFFLNVFSCHPQESEVQDLVPEKQ